MTRHLLLVLTLALLGFYWWGKQPASVPPPTATPVSPSQTGSDPNSTQATAQSGLLQDSTASLIQERKIAGAYADMLEIIHRLIEEGNDSEAEAKLAAVPQEALNDPAMRRNTAILWNNVGVLRAKKVGASGAVSAYKTAVALDPTEHLSYMNLVSAYRALNDPALTPEFLEEGIKLAPENPLPHAFLAEVLLNKSDLQGAQTHLQHATERAAQTPTLQSYLHYLTARIERTKNPEPKPLTAQPVASPATAPSSHAFTGATLQVPVLLVSDVPSSMKKQGFYLASRGDIALVDLAVHHLAEGNGPEISYDHHFRGSAATSLQTALFAAARATGYDPRYLKVNLSLKTTFLQSGVAIDGPSAGVVMAIGIASTILGDSIRPDVCLSGTINLNLEIGRVGGLEDKINGCRQFKYQELILPAGQSSMDVTLKGMSYEIKVTEVHTLAEAYQAATGNPLRASP